MKKIKSKRVSLNAATPKWVKEFGEEYAVPEIIYDDPLFLDESWHNDCAPCFHVGGIYLFCQHPKPELREANGSKRFGVMLPPGSDDPLLFETDSAAEAVTFAKNYVVKQVAAAFCKNLRETIGNHRVGLVNARNKKHGDNCCASHDFCDSNVVMSDSFKDVFGRESYLVDDVEERVKDADDYVWHRAWSLAKACRFNAAEVMNSGGAK